MLQDLNPRMTWMRACYRALRACQCCSACVSLLTDAQVAKFGKTQGRLKSAVQRAIARLNQQVSRRQ